MTRDDLTWFGYSLTERIAGLFSGAAAGVVLELSWRVYFFQHRWNLEAFVDFGWRTLLPFILPAAGVGCLFPGALPWIWNQAMGGGEDAVGRLRRKLAPYLLLAIVFSILGLVLWAAYWKFTRTLP